MTDVVAAVAAVVVFYDCYSLVLTSGFKNILENIPVGFLEVKKKLLVQFRYIVLVCNIFRQIYKLHPHMIFLSR